MAFKFPSLRNVVIGFVGAFFGVQILSLIISSVFTTVPVLQGGSAILLMLLAIAIMTLFVIGTRVDMLRTKETLVFVVIIFGLLAVAYWKLPETFPQIFTIDSTTSQAIRQTLGSIMGGLTG